MEHNNKLSDLSPEEQEAFEDYYALVVGEIDRKDAEWGFQCGTLYGQGISQRTADLEAGAIKELLATLEAVLPYVPGFTAKDDAGRPWLAKARTTLSKFRKVDA